MFKGLKMFLIEIRNEEESMALESRIFSIEYSFFFFFFLGKNEFEAWANFSDRNRETFTWRWWLKQREKKRLLWVRCRKMRKSKTKKSIEKSMWCLMHIMCSRNIFFKFTIKERQRKKYKRNWNCKKSNDKHIKRTI